MSCPKPLLKEKNETPVAIASIGENEGKLSIDADKSVGGICADEEDPGSPICSTSKTFRKRRLTLSTGIHYEPSLSDDEDFHEKSKDETNDLCALPQKLEPTQTGKRNRTCTNEEEKKNDVALQPLKSKVNFSQQMTLEVQRYCPVSHGQRDITQLPNGDTIVMTECNNASGKISPVDLLPFPREIAWTYSCHGIEPIFNECGLDEEDTPSSVAKINQDRGGVVFPYGNCPRTALFSVYDGHGDGGELVAQFAMTEIQRKLKNHPLFDENLAEAMLQTFVAVDESLVHQAQIEPNFSGTTACVVLMRDNHLYIANVGDSRAVIAQKNTTKNKTVCSGDNHKNNYEISSKAAKISSYVNKDLTVDQNPDSPGEQTRIEKCGGFVSPPPEIGLSARVWLDEGCTQIGLAMSRSIGDHLVKPVGVIAKPVVTKYEIQDKDEFMILATDGVWEFLESIDAVKIVAGYIESGDGAEKACQALIEAAAVKWHEFEGDYRDDITVLVIQLKGLW